MLMTSCASDDEQETAPVAEPSADAIVLTASMGDGGSTRGSQDVQTASFDEGELVSVEITPTGGSMQSSVYRAGAATEENGYKNPLTAYSRAITWPANNGTVSIRAYYPSTVASSTTAFTVQDDQSADDDYKLSDLMYADAVNGQAKVSSVPLTFHHALSKIVVNIVGTGSVTPEVLDGCELSVKACKTATITNGVATPVADATAAEDYGYIKIGTGATVAGIIVPQTIDGSGTAQPFIRVKLNNKNLYFKLTTSKTFAERKKYTYTLGLSIGPSDSISLIKSEITDWQNVDLITSM